MTRDRGSAAAALRAAIDGRPLVLVGVAVATLFALWNLSEIVWDVLWIAREGHDQDWYNIASVSPATPYVTPAFRWTPAAAWIWATVVVPLGPITWRLLHIAALAAFRDWRLAAIVGVSFAFWMDLAEGNILTFVAVAAFWAVRENRVAAIAFVILAVLVPRPLMMPILAWLLWRRAEARWTLLVVATIVVLQALSIGELRPFIERLTNSGSELADPANFAPSIAIGWAWYPVALLLAWWAWRRGLLGTASVLVSPYWFGYYLLIVAADWRRLRPDEHSSERRENRGVEHDIARARYIASG